MNTILRKISYGILCGVLSSAIAITAFAEVGVTLYDPGHLPDDIVYQPTASENGLYSTYTPWLDLVHITTQAQRDAGVTIGGEGCQQVRTIAISKSGKTILAGTDTNGIWRNVNEGSYWYNVGSSDFETTYVSDICFDSEIEDTAYAYLIFNSTDKAEDTPNEGIYKTTDGGISWSHVLECNCVAGKLDDVIIAENDVVYVLSDVGLHKSTDGGASWNLIDANTGTAKSLDIKDNVIVTAYTNQSTDEEGTVTYSGQLRYSTDGGVTFAENSTRFTQTVCIDINPVDNSWYVSGVSDDEGTGIYRSTDNGVTFEFLSNPHKNDSLALHAKFGPVVDGGARYYVYLDHATSPFRYSDTVGNKVASERSWVVPTYNRTSLYANYTGWIRQGFDINGSTVYVSCGGVHKSTDRGETFNWINNGFSGLSVFDIVQSYAGDLYFSCSDVGAVISNSAYEERGNYPLFTNLRNALVNATCLGVEPDDGNHIFAYLSTGLLIESYDRGVTYTTVKECTNSQTFIKVLEDGTVYTNDYTYKDGEWTDNQYSIAAVSDIDPNVQWRMEGIDAHATTMVYYSTDGGATWSEEGIAPTRTPISNLIIPDVADKEVCYVVSDFATRQINMDGTIKAFSSGTEGIGVHSFAQNPRNPQHMLMGAAIRARGNKSVGLYESCDGGDSWHYVIGLPGSRSVRAIAFSKNTDEVFVCSMTGVLSYDYTEYANYKAEFSYDYGLGTDESTDYKELFYPGTRITLPLDPSPKFGYEFVGWSDGTTVYQPGDTYTMSGNDVVMTAVWNNTAKCIVPVKIGDVGVVDKTAASDEVVPANSRWNGYDSIVTRDSNIKGKLVLYRFDASEMVGKSAEKVELSIYAARNNAQLMVSAYAVTGDWQPDTITNSSIPAYNTTRLDSFVDADDTYFETKYNFYEIRLDVTAAAENVTKNNPYINIMLMRNDATTSNANFIMGANSAQRPKLIFTGIGEYTTIEGETEKSAVALSNSHIKGYRYIEAEEDGAVVTPILALYNGNTLVEVAVGEKVSLAKGANKVFTDIDLTDVSLQDGYKLSMFVWDDDLTYYTQQVFSLIN